MFLVRWVMCCCSVRAEGYSISSNGVQNTYQLDYPAAIVVLHLFVATERARNAARAHLFHLEFVQTDDLVPAGADFQADSSEADVLEEYGIFPQVVLETILAALLWLEYVRDNTDRHQREKIQLSKSCVPSRS